jgi:glutamine amidotransferase
VIAVVDYGVNNLKSVVRALAAGGHQSVLTADPAVVCRAERVVLPGVGNFGQASVNLQRTGLGDALKQVVAQGRPVMGICLGMQLLFTMSEEAPQSSGLGLLPGRVTRFGDSLPVPHVGWAGVQVTAAGAAHPALAGLFSAGPRFFYHVHSFHPADLPEGVELGFGEYGGRFATIVGRDNLLGVQFHPEKSQRDGIELLSSFVAWQP